MKGDEMKSGKNGKPEFGNRKPETGNRNQETGKGRTFPFIPPKTTNPFDRYSFGRNAFLYIRLFALWLFG